MFPILSKFLQIFYPFETNKQDRQREFLPIINHILKRKKKDKIATCSKNSNGPDEEIKEEEEERK